MKVICIDNNLQLISLTMYKIYDVISINKNYEFNRVYNIRNDVGDISTYPGWRFITIKG